MLWMTKPIHGQGKVVTMDSGFCVAAGIIALHKWSVQAVAHKKVWTILAKECPWWYNWHLFCGERIGRDNDFQTTNWRHWFFGSLYKRFKLCHKNHELTRDVGWNSESSNWALNWRGLAVVQIFGTNFMSQSCQALGWQPQQQMACSNQPRPNVENKMVANKTIDIPCWNHGG